MAHPLRHGTSVLNVTSSSFVRQVKATGILFVKREYFYNYSELYMHIGLQFSKSLESWVIFYGILYLIGREDQT